MGSPTLAPSSGSTGSWQLVLPRVADPRCGALGARYAAFAASDGLAAEQFVSFVGDCLADGTSAASLLATHGQLEDCLRDLIVQPSDPLLRMEWRLGLDRELHSFERMLIAALFTARRQPPVSGGLSDRERAVLSLFAEGLGNVEISRRLTLSPETVRTYAQRAMGKLGAATKAQAVAVALRSGVIS
jgi:DNA-binding CsgD family transcriptional regulator